MTRLVLARSHRICILLELCVTPILSSRNLATLITVNFTIQNKKRIGEFIERLNPFFVALIGLTKAYYMQYCFVSTAMVRNKGILYLAVIAHQHL